MSVERISSPVIITGQGQSFSAVEINGDGFEVVNAAEERDSTGQTYSAGSQSVISVRSDTGSTINASYIKTGVIDANLMRAGLIQTVPSWNTKWYGAPEYHAAVQMGFTGGSIAATAVSTGTGTVSLTLPGGHGLITGDYVRVSGLYFTTGTLLGGVGLNLPTNGPLDYALATVATNTLTYSKADITSGLIASTASIVYVGKALAISTISRVLDNPDNPAELSTVTVTTSAAHGFSVGDYIELTGTIQTMDGVAYVTTVPTSTTFTFKQRFGNDVTFDGTSTGISLPTLGAPAAIKVLKSYTQNADGSIAATSGSIGGFTLSSTSLTAGTGASAVGLLPGTFPFFAGSATAASAPFRVSSAGAVTTTNLTIQGENSAITGVSTNAGLIVMKAQTGQVGAVIEAQKPDGTTTGSVLGLRAGGGGTTGTLGSTIGAVVVYDGTGDQGTLITGGLMISNDYTKAGSASLPLPKDGVIVFTDSVTSSYSGGGDLFQNPVNTINTSGNFRVRKNLTVNDELTVDGGINAFSVVANGGGIYSDALTTGGHAAMRFRSLAEANLGNISMATSGQFYFNTGTGSDRLGDILAGDISASGTITAGTSVTVDDTSGVYFNVASGTDGNIYYSQTSGYFLVNDDWRINMGTTASTSDVYINTSSGYGTLARFSSARRYKQDINDFNVPLSDVLQLRPVTFKWNPETTKSEETGSMTGLIAEEVEAISDEMKRICRYNEETGEIESVQYSQLPVFLIGAIKELAQKNSALESRIAELEAGA